MSNLKIEDITLEGGTKAKIFVKEGKGEKPRNATVTDELTDKLYKYTKEKQLEPKDFLFTNKSGNPYKSGKSLNKTLKRYSRIAGIEKNITNHSFRH